MSYYAPSVNREVLRKKDFFEMLFKFSKPMFQNRYLSILTKEHPEGTCIVDIGVPVKPL